MATSVGEDRQADTGRPTQVANRVQSRPSGSARVEHVVNQDDFGPFDHERNLSASENRPAIASAEVIAVESDLDSAHGNLDPQPLLKSFRQSLRQGHPSRADSNHRQWRVALTAFGDLSRQAVNQAV